MGENCGGVRTFVVRVKGGWRKGGGAVGLKFIHADLSWSLSTLIQSLLAARETVEVISSS